jgi:DNA-binding NarL/FixJ family response regulator
MTLVFRKGRCKEAMDILLVDDHKPTREEMCFIINRQEDMKVVAESPTGEDAIGRAREIHPDIVIMDIVLPGMTGVKTTELIVKECPTTRVLVLSNHSGPHLVRAVMTAGGKGYVRKDHAYQELTSALRTVYAGGEYLGENVNE